VREQRTTLHVLDHYLWLLSLSVGLALGAGIGAAMGRVGTGVAIGTTTGVAVGLFLARRARLNTKDR